MVSISGLRQIVTDMHSVFPQGMRKAVRSEVLGKLKRVNDSVTVIEPEIANKFSQTYEKDFFNYYRKLEKQEGDRVIKKTLNNLGVTIKNKTTEEISNNKKLETIKGLLLSKEGGLRLPKKVIFEKMKNQLGVFYPILPKRIYLNPENGYIAKATVHETIHLNDFGFKLTSTIPVLDRILRIPGKITTMLNSKWIKNNLNKYATKNREEFIAATGQELVYEGRKWSDLDPKIEKLYKLFKGPRLKLGQQ